MNAGAYSYAKRSDGFKYSRGCYQKECAQYFPSPFVDEETAENEPVFTKLPDTPDKEVYSENYKNYLDTVNKKSLKGKLAVKVFFENPNLDDSSYVIRYIDKASSLKNSVQEYLNSLTPEEKN